MTRQMMTPHLRREIEEYWPVYQGITGWLLLLLLLLLYVCIISASSVARSKYLVFVDLVTSDKYVVANSDINGHAGRH